MKGVIQELFNDKQPQATLLNNEMISNENTLYDAEFADALIFKYPLPVDWFKRLYEGNINDPNYVKEK